MTGIHDIAPAATPISVERPYQALLVVTAADLHDPRLAEDSTSILAFDPRPGVDTNPVPAFLPGHDQTSGNNRKALRLLTEGHRPFLLLAAPAKDEDLFEFLALSFFSRNYLRVAEAPVVGFPLSPGLIEKLQRQGWAGIVQWDTRLSRWLTAPHQITTIAGELLSGSSGTAGLEYILIRGKDLDDTLLLEQELHQAYRSLSGNYPELQNLIVTKRRLEKTVQALDIENKVLRERLGNAGTTIAIIRNKYKEDYDILFRWYQAEYESLPRWYKRFGQLIRVLTGKRSVKSLHNAVLRRLHRRKKYKNNRK